MPTSCVDYESTALRKGGRPIAWPRVVGVGVEKAFKAADQTLGVGCLEAHHLDGFVTFFQVERRGEVNVTLKEADATLAVQVAKEVTKKMTSLGFARVGLSDSPARGVNGKFAYSDDGDRLSHDLIYEKVPVAGLWSTEVRTVNAHAYAGLLAARGRNQTDAKKWWNDFKAAGLDKRWSGRILVLAWLKDDRQNFDVRGDIYTDASGWRPLFGWPGGVASVIPAQLPTVQPAQPARLQATRAQPKASSLSSSSSSSGQNQRGQKRPWAEVEAFLFVPPQHKLHALAPRQKVARVPDLYDKARKADKKHIKENLQRWLKVGFKEDRDYGKGPASANGGPSAWVANQRACAMIWGKL